MLFGFWNTARANKENIFYAILTVFLLERVRTGWNRALDVGRKAGLEAPAIERRQRVLITKASLLYALPFLLPVVKYIYRSIEELSWSVQGLVALKNTWAFFGIVAVTECFLAIVIYNLLRIYVDRMNAATSFFTKIGRNIWDGSKVAVQMSTDMGTRVAGGVRRATGSAWRLTKDVSSLVVRPVAMLLPAATLDRASAWLRPGAKRPAIAADGEPAPPLG